MKNAKKTGKIARNITGADGMRQREVKFPWS
jgi:hypothetical protein